MTIKRKIQTKHKLPTLNWIVLKPNQVKGTIFNELDDDKLLSIIDFNEFEEQFKIGTSLPMTTSGDDQVEGLVPQGSKRFKRPELQSLLEHNRLRNIGMYGHHLVKLSPRSSRFYHGFLNFLFQL